MRGEYVGGFGGEFEGGNYLCARGECLNELGLLLKLEAYSSVFK